MSNLLELCARAILQTRYDGSMDKSIIENKWMFFRAHYEAEAQAVLRTLAENIDEDALAEFAYNLNPMLDQNTDLDGRPIGKPFEVKWSGIVEGYNETAKYYAEKAKESASILAAYFNQLTKPQGEI